MKKYKVNSSLIILTRNEISGLKAMLSKIPKNCVDEMFAVDYNSKDGTIEYFKKRGIRVIHQNKAGRAEAFRIGVNHAKGSHLVFFSPDGNEDPRDIPKLLDMLLRGYDLAIASRFMRGGRNEEDDKILKFRLWANLCFTFCANIVFHGNVTDSINGYRAIKKDAYDKLYLDANGFAIEYQMTMRAMKLQYTIAEIPTREGDRIGGSSTSYAIPTGIQFVRCLLREIFIGTSFAKNSQISS